MTLTLTQDLQSSKIRLEEFKNIADRILQYMPAVIDEKVVYHEYLICSRSEEHTSELQSHSFISYAVFCLKKKIQ